MSRPQPPARAAFGYFIALETRWMDNDVYGHVNNVQYYSWFDTLIARYLMEAGGFDPLRDPIIGLAVDSGCRYHASIAFPDTVHAGLKVAHLGRSSVRYEIGIFKGEQTTAAADGHFVHVFVDRATQRPAPIPARLRAAFETIAAPAAPEH